ncbi:hypothetical protein NUU61_001611 [Penicillium alfredii]|uniref:Uncharacterized protein n=1 Tax=Penicillium alfredii TaxID=1506179 RepID=A0A9W9KKR1_9EURO|nr:uncharacterized protein NUU61_001611 [Penicillium alfredii]KAJ5110354.1 hypothetical protein NUU61_001611 [Penicillium alfredii]
MDPGYIAQPATQSTSFQPWCGPDILCPGAQASDFFLYTKERLGLAQIGWLELDITMYSSRDQLMKLAWHKRAFLCEWNEALPTHQSLASIRTELYEPGLLPEYPFIRVIVRARNDLHRGQDHQRNE